MKLKEAYENYSYNNIGQFRALSETLGYKTEYHDGSYLFHKGDDSIQLSWMKSDLKLKKTGMNSEPRSQKKRFVRSLTKTRQMSLHTSKNLVKKRNQCDSVE